MAILSSCKTISPLAFGPECSWAHFFLVWPPLKLATLIEIGVIKEKGKYCFDTVIHKILNKMLYYNKYLCRKEMKCQDNTPKKHCKVLTINVHGNTSEKIVSSDGLSSLPISIISLHIA